MTVRIARSFELAASPPAVWEFIADPSHRARAISVVEDYSIDETNGHRATWQVSLPIPLLRRTITVETEDIVRKPDEYVQFVGDSKVMHVTGEHEIVEIDDGCRLENRFVVDGKVPGVETFFERNLDRELENIKQALERHLRSRA